MDEDYTDPATVEFALKEWGEVFQRLPRIDAVFVPGGDPGKAPPRILMPMLAQQQRQLVKFHPQAKMWISPQGFTGEWMEQFLGMLRQESPDWLFGVVHGPWIHIPVPEFRKMIPEQIRPAQLPGYHPQHQLPVPGARLGRGFCPDRGPRNDQPSPAG